MVRRQGAFYLCFLVGLLVWNVIPARRVMAAANLVLSHLTSPIDPVDRYLLRKSAEYIAKKSGNKFTITIYPGGELGTEPELQYQRAVNGNVDIALGLAGFTPDQFPGTMVAELPGFAPNAVVGTEKLLAAMDLIKNEYKDARLLALWTSDRAVLMMGQKVVRTVADLRGLKIGVLTRAQGETIKALGAMPKVLPETALYRSLKTGYVDGLMITPIYLMSFDLGQVAKTFTVGPFPATVFFLVMNDKSYDGLDAADKALLDHATGIGMSKRAGRLYKNASAFSLGKEEKAGKTIVRLSPEEEKKWLEAMAPVKANTIKRLETKGINAGKLLSAMGVRE
jgi:TRAP-type C4-dicarboxylate transport system substrate-binding protein